MLSQVIAPSDSSRSYAGACKHCRYILPPLNQAAPIFFEKGSVTCSHCSSEVDLWQAALAESLWTPGSFGATRTSIVAQIETGKFHRFDFADYGAPSDAHILSMTYTGQGGPDGAVSVLEWHSNQSHHRYIGTVVSLFGVPLGEGKVPRVGNVAIAANWIHREESDAWPYLVSAIESVATQDYSPALVFAQSAVEISMMPLIAKRLERYASRERVKRFMSGDLTYSHALNVVLPYICAGLGLRPLPEEIMAGLNSLCTRRNTIVHRGTKVSSITQEEAMEGMTAAAFGFEYVRYITPHFDKP